MTPNKPPILAIVCAGGGTSCSYSGGALSALAKELGLLQPDYIIAASGSAGSAMYYLTGQLESIQRTWTKHICSPHFLSFKRLHKMMDVDYLVDTIFKITEPLDLEKLANVHTRYFIAVKNATTGKGRYISCREELNIHDVLRATKALPIFYGRKVTINGESYVDSAFMITKEHGVLKALELGATHILVIEIHSRKQIGLKAIAGKIATHISGNKPEPPTNLNDVKILRIGPDLNPAPAVTRNPKLLYASFNKGYNDVIDNAEIRDFLAPFIQA
jgi:predicted patatin/cPLA2 family phospholipase